MLTSEKTFQHVGGLTWDLVDDRVVVLDADGAAMITLNPIASMLWPQLESHATVEGLTDILRDNFAKIATEQLRVDVKSFLDELLGEGLIEVADPA